MFGCPVLGLSNIQVISIPTHCPITQSPYTSTISQSRNQRGARGEKKGMTVPAAVHAGEITKDKSKSRRVARELSIAQIWYRPTQPSTPDICDVKRQDLNMNSGAMLSKSLPKASYPYCVLLSLVLCTCSRYQYAGSVGRYYQE